MPYRKTQKHTNSSSTKQSTPHTWFMLSLAIPLLYFSLWATQHNNKKEEELCFEIRFSYTGRNTIIIAYIGGYEELLFNCPSSNSSSQLSHKWYIPRKRNICLYISERSFHFSSCASECDRLKERKWVSSGIRKINKIEIKRLWIWRFDVEMRNEKKTDSKNPTTSKNDDHKR